ncbi:hypothetical protein [Leifsonia shinshuensis]|uniref:hypothetical protein n=1 Tax=Leifsonia shinshuensis TaxID=150026 RepID=UPI002866C31B|nr:hypothetical protein [Leifsonia shinshuensis]MDR6970293.1 hypothetical protein [Leifsonia shinshuensis]
MFVEGTLRWQVTEDCPWDLLMALAVRDLAGLSDRVRPTLPALDPAVSPALRPQRTGGPDRRMRTRPVPLGGPARSQPHGDEPAEGTDASDPLARQWQAWFEVAADRHRRLTAPLLQPPHFEAFDRAIDLQDAIITHYDAAAGWAAERHAEYVRSSAQNHAQRAADIVDVVHEREHELRRQAGYFRLDIDVLPLAEKGAWIVGPHTVAISATMRDDSVAFRDWLRPLVAALV